LWKAKRKKRILFLADRNVVVDQTRVNDFRPFGAAMAKLTTSSKTSEREDGTEVELTTALDKKRRYRWSESNVSHLKKSLKNRMSFGESTRVMLGEPACVTDRMACVTVASARLRDDSPLLRYCLSEPYAAFVRSGKRRPHPRHWQVLAKLVGFGNAEQLERNSNG
jgi:hypothetical protein